jgi:hypothetical protein
MTFSEAKMEFDIRYYLWAISEFEKEIEEAFPTLRLFKAGSPWLTHQFMLTLSKSDQLVLARSLLKRFHPNAVKTLCETCSTEEESLRSQRGAAFDNIVSVGEEIRARKEAGEPVKLASKRKLRTVMTAQFKAAFGGECIDLACVDEEPDLRFKMQRAGWFVTTSFYFGRSKPVLSYMHGIASEEPLIYRPGIGPMVMGAMVSFNSYLGISSQTEWHYLTDEEVEPSCAAALTLCAHFFEVLPKLLEGLECDTVVPDGADIRGF